MTDVDLEARLDARLVRTIKEMGPEAYRALMAQLLQRMGLKVTAAALTDDVAFLEGEREGAKYLVMASRRPEHASEEGVRIAKEKAMAEGRAPVLILAHAVDGRTTDLAAREEVSLADREKLTLLIRRYELWHQLTKDADQVILEREGSRALPSAVPFDTLVQRADEDLRAGRNREALESLEAAVALKSEHDVAWRMKANAHYDLEEWDEALESVGQALRIRPGDPTTWYMAGVVLHRLGKLDQELQAYEQALRYARRLHPALLNKGATQFALGLREEALRTFDEMLRYYPRDPQALGNRALVLRSLGRDQEALEAYEAQASLHPDDVAALMGKASVLSEMGHLLEAVDAWKEAVAADRKRADLWLRLAQAEKAAGMLDEAKRSYQVAESLDIGLEEARQGEESAEAALSAFQPPSDRSSPREDGLAQKYVDAALLLQALGRSEEALREVDRALEIEPRSATAALRKAGILMDMGRLEEAVPALTPALKESPYPADAALELEAISYRMGRRDEGVRVLKPHLEDPEARKRTALAEASAGRPEAALELLGLPEGRDLSHDRLRALALMSKGDHAQSSELLAKLSKAYGPSPQLLNDLAVSLRMENRLEEAEEALERAIEAEPRYPDAWNNLGCLHYLQGAFEEGERAFKEAILLDRRPAFMLHLGMAQLARDDLDAAEASFGSALRLEASAEALNCLGIVAERRKDNARALELYEEALKRAPEFRDAQYNKARAKAALKVG